MKLLLTLIMLVFTVSCYADVNARLQTKASDFFRNPSAKRNLIKLLNSSPEDNWNDEEEQDIPSFELDGEFGVLVTTGNTNTSMLKLALEADHELESWSNVYNAQILQRNTEVDDDEIGDIDTRRIQFSSQFDYKLNLKNRRLFAYTEYDDNQFLQLSNQLTAVVGWSQLAWQLDHTEFRYSIGPGWTRLKQDDTGLVIEEMIVRATANYAYEFPNDARFRQSLSAEMGEVNSKAKAQTSVSAKIFERFAMKFSFTMALDENVSRNIDSFTTQTSISMVYQFF